MKKIVHLLAFLLGLGIGSLGAIELPTNIEMGQSVFSESNRLELRDQNTVGHALVSGTETKGSPTGETPATWDTTSLPVGWQSVSSGADTAAILKLDVNAVAVEGGRLVANTTWDNTKTHVVRNWVVVPNGVTLTVTEGTIVKFCENTGIRVETGGRVQVNGAENADVFFASIGNDTYAGDTNLREGDFAANSYGIVMLSGGLWSDNGYWVTPDANQRPYPIVEVHDAIASFAGGVVRIPVTVSGTRNAPFSIDWQIDNAQGCFRTTTGTLSWSGTSEGMKYIEIPLANVETVGIMESTLTVMRARSVEVASETASVKVYHSDVSVGGVIEEGASEASPGTEIDTNVEGTLVVDGARKIAYSTQWGRSAATTVRVNEQLPDGSTRTLADVAGPVESCVEWTPTQGAGLYRLSHQAGGETLTARLAVLGEETGVISAGELGQNVTWTADKVWVVRGEVVVQSGVTLTIEPGAVVKFMPGAKLRVVAGGVCIAKGAIFTHVNDDSVGGDTLFDGAESSPVMEDYEVIGSVTDDETTEYRYTAPVVLSGTISSNTRWRGWKVYHVTGNLTVASGVTLTVEPGCVVKFDEGCSMTVNGALDAQGIRAAPIVFTSAKDDDWGGDTNGDGDEMYAQVGDWASINVSASGKVVCDYVKILYGGNNGSSTADVFLLNGGTVTFKNSSIEHAYQYCVGLENGFWQMENSFFADFHTAFRHFASCLCVNSVFYDFTYLSNNGGQSFTNCVIMRYNTALCWWADDCVYKNCVIFNPVGFGPQSSEKCGLNGNIWGDPLFLEPDNGDFRIAKQSPCIDAGDGMVAPELDYRGQPRNGVPDIGIFEYQGSDARSSNDLAAVDVTSAATVTAGEALNVGWRIANCGTKPVEGSWRDRVTLTDGVSEYALGTVVSSGVLPVGATNEFRGTFAVPAELEGTWRVCVHVNTERDIYEGTVNVTNNTVTSERTTTVSVRAESIEDGFTGAVPAGGSASAKFAVSVGEPLIGRIVAPVGTIVYFGDGFAPTAANYSAKARVDANGGVIGIPADVATAYFTVTTENGAAAEFSIAFESGALAVRAANPGSVPSSGKTGVKVMGANFAEGCVAELLTGGVVCAGAVEKTTCVSATELVLALDCDKLQAGRSYAVRVRTANGETAVLDNAVTVASAPPKAVLKAKLDVPSTVRQGRTITAFVDYENTGNVDLPAPIFEIVSEGQIFKVDGRLYTNSVKVVGLAVEAPHGTLRPGEPQRLAVQVTCMAATVKWTLRSYHAAQEGAKKTRVSLAEFYNATWIAREQSLNSQMYRQLKAETGETWSELYQKFGEWFSSAEWASRGGQDYNQRLGQFLQDAYYKAKDSCETTEAKTFSLSQPKLLSTPNGRELRLGDVWCFNAAGNMKLLCPNGGNDRREVLVSVKGAASSDAAYFTVGKPTIVICHGNKNSVEEAWIREMAVAFRRKHGANYNVCAVNWKNGLWPYDDGAIKDTASVAGELLFDYGGCGARNLYLIGHSHGAHVAGRMAAHFGKVKLLVGLDASTEDVGIHGFFFRTHFWKGASADLKVFYKSSWNASLGTGGSEMDADFNLLLFRSGDFYELNFVRETAGTDDRHGYSWSWFTRSINSSAKLYRFGYSWLVDGPAEAKRYWTAETGLALPKRGSFAGIVNADQTGNVECDYMGLCGEWKYQQVLGGLDKVDDFNEKLIGAVEYEAVDLNASNPCVYESGDTLVTGNKTPNTVTLKFLNFADNITLPWDDLKKLSSKYLPWRNGNMSNGIWLIRLDGWSEGDNVIAQVASGSLTASLVKRLISAPDIKPLKIWDHSSSYYGDDYFAKPNDSKPAEIVDGIFVDSKLFGSRRLGCDEDNLPLEDGEKCIILGVVGSHGDTLRVYDGDLAPDFNNYIARVVTVYDGEGNIPIITDDEPMLMKMAAAPNSIRYALGGTNQRQPSLDSLEVEAESNGVWSVVLNGAHSIFSPGSERKFAWFDDDFSFVGTSSYMAFGGILPEGVDYLETTAYLSVMDDSEPWQCAKCVLKIQRTSDDPGDDEDEEDSDSPTSEDPNALEGPEGIGEARFVKPGEWMTYTIYFENKADAEASAAMVTVTNPLNEWLDWESFEMLDVAFGSQADTGLLGKSSGTSSVTMDGTNTSVRTEVAVDLSTGVATWFLRVVDPDGDDEGWPLDPYAGFLPPNDETHRGEGRISYRIKVREDAPPFAVIDNSATIVFDYNDPIETDPAWWNTVSPVDESIETGDYVKWDLAELGFDVPTDGTAYTVKAYGLPAGLKLVKSAAVTKKVKDKKTGKTKTVVVTPAGVNWWIEGVPTAALDFLAMPPYLAITAGGRTSTVALPLEVIAQDVTDLGEIPVGVAMNEQHWLPGLPSGWSVSGLPTGLKYTAKLLTTKKTKTVGKKKVTTVTTNALPDSVYGTPTKAGLYTITAKKKVGGFYETLKYRVVVAPKPVDAELFGETLTNLTTMAYVPFEWNLTNDVAAVGGTVAKVTGLPAGLAFAAKDVYGYTNAKKKTGNYLKQSAQTIVGTPTKPGTYVVTFTKNVKSGKKTVAKTAQILWTVVANDTPPEMDFNAAGGEIVDGSVALAYTDLLAFTATEGAKVTASGLPKGITLADLGGGQWGFKGFTTKAGTYLVTVKATMNGRTVSQRLALKVAGLPAWAKGTFDGYAVRKDGQSGALRLSVTSAGKISGTLRELGTNWTVSASCFTEMDEGEYHCTNLVAKYTYSVKSGKKTVKKTLTRHLAFGVCAEERGTSTRGCIEGNESGVCEFIAYQNLWAGAYKQLGKQLFYQSKKKPYRTYTYTAASEGCQFLAERDKLTLKITSVGAVTATLAHPTGKKDKKTKKEIVYKATLSTTLLPTSDPEDGAENFRGIVVLYFPATSANNFPGLMYPMRFQLSSAPQ